jgi:hypothetical protein
LPRLLRRVGSRSLNILIVAEWRIHTSNRFDPRAPIRCFSLSLRGLRDLSLSLPLSGLGSLSLSLSLRGLRGLSLPLRGLRGLLSLSLPLRSLLSLPRGFFLRASRCFARWALSVGKFSWR